MKLFKDNIFHDRRIAKVSKELNIDENIVQETIDIMYDYIRLKLQSVEVEDENSIMDEEEFDKTFPTISIPKLGTIVPSYRKYVHIMKKRLIKNAKRNN